MGGNCQSAILKFKNNKITKFCKGVKFYSINGSLSAIKIDSQNLSIGLNGVATTNFCAYNFY